MTQPTDAVSPAALNALSDEALRPVKPAPDPGTAERQRLIREATAKGERVGGFRPPVAVPVPAEARGIPPLALTHVTCKWPLNFPQDAGGFLFCGAPVQIAPYCPFHRPWAYTTSQTSPSQFERGLRRYA